MIKPNLTDTHESHIAAFRLVISDRPRTMDTLLDLSNDFRLGATVVADAILGAMRDEQDHLLVSRAEWDRRAAEGIAQV